VTTRLLCGDALEQLRLLPDESVQCCITSPPYWGLRDYGIAGQLGLERTPEEYVAKLVKVFREVRRVLRGDGTLWLNLGDCYHSGDRGGYRKDTHRWENSHMQAMAHGTHMEAVSPNRLPQLGLKDKDLVGIPWAVAKALQAPYYTGRIASEADRAWLAGFLDGEGTITFVERDRGEEHTPTHDVRVFVTNCDDAPLRHFAALTAGHVYQHDGERENRFGSRPCFRWQMGTHDGALLLRELYPYLRTKRAQAALVWTLYTTLRHKNGHARTPSDVIERRKAIAERVRALNAGQPVDLPDWLEEPPPCTEPGYYLRRDIIWHKPNPMPESVTDRPTSSHEYVFLLTKSARYYYDGEAIKEPANPASVARYDYAFGGAKAEQLTADEARGPGTRTHPIGMRKPSGKHSTTAPNASGRRITENVCAARQNGADHDNPFGQYRNRRTVWTIPTQPYPEAHFATFPEALVEPCIAAGTKLGDTVLDPFAGSGTVGVVALRAGRDFIGIDLNPEYIEMARRRIEGTAPLFAEVGE
jgi:DNA modification methylase